MKFAGLTMMLVAVAMLVPLASAANEESVAFSGNPNSVPSGTFLLNGTGGGSDVALPANSPVTWAIPTELGAAAHFVNLPFTADVYLHAFTTSTIKFELGYIDGSGFHAIATGTAPVLRSNRTVIPASITLPVTKTPADIGVSHLTITTSGVYGSHSYRAIRLTSSADNSVYTSASLLNSPHLSTATIPLPELPAALLFGMGGLLVAGVVFTRRTK
jgi:hypothetical protein